VPSRRLRAKVEAERPLSAVACASDRVEFMIDLSWSVLTVTRLQTWAEPGTAGWRE
jgi:hypothetical protein